MIRTLHLIYLQVKKRHRFWMPWDPVGLSLGTKHPNVSGTARSQGGHGARFVGATREERGFPKRPHVVTG